ncbi:DUF1559 domain-containing protein [Haloferula rosea]|uniref:DUF1559 domain-containing protein n=2 Tax=Haloferula rosea TaxID=490093 RepID=A0A934R9V9_9BACT|nr:DUF1559 domain-containing protein [Haloferula rosea]
MIGIVIIVVLAALSLPLARKMNGAAEAATCMSNVRQVGGAILMYAGDNHQRLPPLQPAFDRELGKRPPIWTVYLANKGYLWDGVGTLPCGTGVWTCPSCDFMSDAYGGYGVVEGSIFVYEEMRPEGVREPGSLRLNRIKRPASTWLVGDTSPSADELNKGWYALWPNPSRWSGHGPAARHGGKVNVCMADGHAEALTVREIAEREITFDVIR